MAVDRDSYGARQTELLAALLAGSAPPAGVAVAQADAAGRSLRRKRAAAVRQAWPALTLALGPRFGERFDAYAREHATPAFGEATSDGLAFATSPFAADAGGDDDDARVERLFARAALVRGRGGWHARRGVFVAALALRHPYRRVLVVVRAPGLGVRHIAVRW